MIECVMGIPGSGKTMYTTYRAYKAIKSGRKVFSNYPIIGAYKIEFDDLIEYTFPPNSLVIIDEAGRWFSSRKWADLPDQVFDLFTLHRHMRLDLLVAVQNFARIDKALREVVELVWWADNRFYLPFFTYDGYYDVEMLGLKGEVQRKDIVWRWTRARNYYDTHIMSSMIKHNFIPEIPWSDNKIRNLLDNIKFGAEKVSKGVYNVSGIMIKWIQTNVRRVIKFGRPKKERESMVSDKDVVRGPKI